MPVNGPDARIGLVSARWRVLSWHVAASDVFPGGPFVSEVVGNRTSLVAPGAASAFGNAGVNGGLDTY